MNRRIAVAFAQIGPLPAPVVVLNPGAGFDGPEGALHVVTDAVARDALAARGCALAEAAPARAGTVIVCVPRSKTYARALIAQAADMATDLVVVDGAKTDGIDAIWRDLRDRASGVQSLTKAHGRCMWCAPVALPDWRDPGPRPGPAEMVTQIGVFSEGKVDPGSRALVAALPPLSGCVADLGAGWGYLSRALLAMPDLAQLHLVEADRRALECARANLSDARAVFHWADATRWRAPARVDTVVMNPPFHTGRKADPALGIAFIAAAARILDARGRLFMVANRHLPYEAPLRQHFRDLTEIGGDAAFKLFMASRPLRQ